MVAFRRRVKRMWEEPRTPVTSGQMISLTWMSVTATFTLLLRFGTIAHKSILMNAIVINLFVVFSLRRNQNEPQRRKFFPFIGSSGGCFPHHLFLMLLANVTKMPTTLCCVHRPLRQGGDGPVSHHLCTSGAWNASESYRCLLFVSVPGGGYAPARRYKTNTPAECLFPPLRFRGQNQTTTN